MIARPLVLLITTVALALPLAAADREPRQRSLMGIEEVYVNIEDLNETALELGLTRETLRTDVESRLRSVGLRVTSDDSAEVHLYVQAIVVPILVMDKVEGVAVGIRVECRQNARLLRNGDFQPLVTTWDRTSVQVTADGEHIRRNIGESVDLFANDDLAANLVSREQQPSE